MIGVLSTSEGLTRAPKMRSQSAMLHPPPAVILEKTLAAVSEHKITPTAHAELLH